MENQIIKSRTLPIAAALVAVAASKALRATLRGLEQLDPLTLGFVASFYLIIVAAAICSPAPKALRVDPGNILRVD